MTNIESVFFSKQEDGTFLAVSIDSPRFCVLAANDVDALAKANRIVEYYNANKHKVLGIKARETRVITLSFEEKELCLA